jgi:GH24 family phage-related lysozyme (muramidase)
MSTYDSKSVSAAALEGIALNQLSDEEKNALDVLIHLRPEQLTELKNIFTLPDSSVIGPASLAEFLLLASKASLFFSPEAVNSFKKDQEIDNEGILEGVIGSLTASAYIDKIRENEKLIDVFPQPPEATSQKINPAGLNLVKEFEGLHKLRPDGKVQAYLDPVNVWTIGYGHTKGVKPGDVITKEKAENLLKEDMEEFEKVVEKLTTVPLNSNQFSALVSFTFNIGDGAFNGSTLRKLLNQSKYGAAAEQFTRWVYGTVNGQRVKLPGLVRRREAERRLFLA